MLTWNDLAIMVFIGLLVSLGTVAGAMTLGTVMGGHLSRKLGVFGSVYIYLSVGVLLSIAAILLSGQTRMFVSGSHHLTTIYLLPGLLNIVLIGSQLKVVTTAGARTLTMGLFAGQILTGLLLDQAGAFGQPHVPLSGARITGAIMAIAGLLLTFMGSQETRRLQ